MRKLSTFILTFFVLIPIALGFGSGTVKKIDEIENNTGTDIILSPNSNVIINHFGTETVLQSGPNGEVLETSILPGEIVLQSRLINTTAPLVGGGDLSSDLTLSMPQSNATVDGFLSSTDWNTFNNKQDALPLNTNGDILYYNTGNASLSIGSEGQLLTVSSGLPSWEDAPISTTLDTKGQLQGYSTTNANVGPCLDDQILVFDTLEATGWKCSDLPTTSPTTTEGDLIVRGATEDERLAIGTSGQLLTSNGTTASWQDAPVSTTLTTKGDIQTFSTANDRLAVGADGDILVADSNETTGLGWKDDLSDKISQKYKFYSLLENARFEKDGIAWTITGCTASYPTNGVLKKSLRLDCLNETFSIKQEVTNLTQFEKQGVSYNLQYKTDFIGANVSSLTNGVRDREIALSEAPTFKAVRGIPFIIGDTSNGLEVYSDTNITGFIEIDDVEVDFGQNISEVNSSYYVGSISLANDCQYVRASSVWGKMLDVDTCSASSIVGEVSLPNNTLEAGVKINNYRTDGYYKVEWSGILFNNTSSAGYFEFSKSGTHEGRERTYTNPNTSIDNQLTASIRFNSSDTGEVFLISSRVGTGDLIAYGNASDTSKVNVYFYPDDKSTIASQETELTAKTANTFSASIDGGGVVSGDSYDFINGDCSLVGSNRRCLLNDLAITQALQCAVTIEADSTQANTIQTGLGVTTTSYFEYNVTISGVGNNTFPVRVVCNKHDSDLNKSQTIKGKFENINSSELVQVKYYQTDGTTIAANTGNINFITKEKDNYNSWNGTVFTAPKTSRYIIQGSTNENTCAADHGFYAYVNGIKGELVSYQRNDACLTNFGGTFDLTEGQTLSIRSNRSMALRTNEPKSNFIAITEVPDTESVISNFLKDNFNIDNSNLVRVSAKGGIATSVAINTPFSWATETKDTHNAWDGTTFVAPESGFYILTGSFRQEAVGDMEMNVQVLNSSDTQIDLFGVSYQLSDIISNISGGIELEKGQKLRFLNGGGTITPNVSDIHWRINITQMPDQKAIIEELAAKTMRKCQTKTLSANVITTGVMSDLTFNNLVIGKQYSITGQAYLLASTAFNIKNGSTIIGVARNMSGGSYEKIVNPNTGVFTANDTTITFDKVLGSTVYGDGTKTLTFMELCEENDTLLTTEFN